jgi:hypothetical protein
MRRREAAAGGCVRSRTVACGDPPCCFGWDGVSPLLSATYGAGEGSVKSFVAGVEGPALIMQANRRWDELFRHLRGRAAPLNAARAEPRPPIFRLGVRSIAGRGGQAPLKWASRGEGVMG